MVLGVRKINLYMHLEIIFILAVESSSKQFSLQPYLLPCNEAVIMVEYEGIENDKKQFLTINHTPTLSISLNDTVAVLDLENKEFQLCPDLHFELQCQEVEKENYTSARNFTTKIINVKEYLGLECRIR